MARRAEPRGAGVARLAAALAWAAAAAAAQPQVLLDGPVEVQAPRILEAVVAHRPLLLRVEGRIPTPADAGAPAEPAASRPAGAEAAAPADLEIDLGPGGAHRLSEFAILGGRCAAWIPIEAETSPAEASIAVALRPSGAGVRLDRVVLEPAGALDLEIADARTRKPIPGWVGIVALDGFEAPHFGRRVEARLAGAGALCPAGRGRLLTPLGVTATLAATSTLLHAPERRRVAANPSGRATAVRFLLASVEAQEGAEVVAAAPEVPLAGDDRAALDLFDRVQGIASRRAGSPGFDAAQAARDPEAFARVLLDPDRFPPLLEPPTLTAPLRDLRPLRTMRLATGALVHTNGPLFVLRGLHRWAPAPEISEVRAKLEITWPAGVERGMVVVATADREHFRQAVRAGDIVPIALAAGPGTRVLLSLRGDPYPGEPLVAPPPLAFRTFLTP